MKEALRSALIPLCAGAVLVMYIALKPPTPAGPAVAGPAPAFEMASLDGGSKTLKDYRGQVVFLNFWATWCDTCAEEMPLLEELYKKHKAKGFALLAAATDEEGEKLVRPFIKEYRVSFPVLLADQSTVRAYAVLGLPTAYLIDAQGMIVNKYFGPIDVLAVQNDILRELARKGS